MIDSTKTTPEKLAEMNDSLIADNNYLRSRIKELEAKLDNRDGLVCGDCDGSGWLENRVDGKFPCTCMTEAEPYQLLQERVITLESELQDYHNMDGLMHDS